jgi:transglutaminase-like putative cysteine protease
MVIRRAQAQTDYDKAMAIKRYLAGISYIEAGTSPPSGVDGVDYFLATARTGNCTNFASAMVVMLRSAGVPARFATGYIVRELSDNGKMAVVRAKDYHAWPEVYFPGYGWVEFEPTVSQPTLVRPTGEAASNVSGFLPPKFGSNGSPNYRENPGQDRLIH